MKGTFGLLLLVGVVSSLAQGPLEPVGPPAESMRTLEEIHERIETPRTPISSLPYTIDEPGSYYLTQDLYGRSGEHGIHVQTNNVTIDLNGFTLFGVTNQSGIYVYWMGQKFTGLRIRNGRVCGWGGNAAQSGVWAMDAEGTVVEDVFFSDNKWMGLRAGRGTRVERCAFLGNQFGTELGGNSLVVNSVALDNIAGGLFVGAGCEVRDCVASGNGTHGISVGAGSRVANCVANGNGDAGIMSLMGGCSFVDCVSSTNTYGIYATHNSLIARNTCAGNDGANEYASGIYIYGSGNRIEDNHVQGNLSGIRVSYFMGSTNLVLRNTAIRNVTMNYNLQAGTVYGPIVSLATPGPITNTNPWANFEL